MQQTSTATANVAVAATTSSPAQVATEQQLPIQFPDSSVRYPVLSSAARGSLPPPITLPFPPITIPYLHKLPFTSANSSQSHSFLHSSSTLSAPPAHIVRPHAHSLLKDTPSPSFAPLDNYDKDLKDKVADDTFFLIRDRKVRISDRGSIFALCRSWLRNGYPEQSQPQYGDTLKSLPRPLPMPESSSLKRKEKEDEESDKDEGAVEIPCTKELLRRHIKRAKRIRERLREERLQRIKRYKGRLSLLLPPPVEQCRNDLGNGP